MLRSFTGAPVGSDFGEFADDERLDIRVGGFFIEPVGTDIAVVWVGEANDLTCVTGIGENFLIAGERCIENDFPSPARAGAGGAALKYAPVFERENGFCGWRVQSYLLPKSFFRCCHVRKRLWNHAEAIEGPVGEDGFAVDGLTRHGTEDA